MSKRITPYPLRMPQDLRDRLEEQARENGRSLNAEIVKILESALGKELITIKKKNPSRELDYEGIIELLERVNRKMDLVVSEDKKNTN